MNKIKEGRKEGWNDFYFEWNPIFRGLLYVLLLLLPQAAGNV